MFKLLVLLAHMLGTFDLQVSSSLHNRRKFSLVHSSAWAHVLKQAHKQPFCVVVVVVHFSWLVNEVHCCVPSGVNLRGTDEQFLVLSCDHVLCFMLYCLHNIRNDRKHKVIKTRPVSIHEKRYKHHSISVFSTNKTPAILSLFCKKVCNAKKFFSFSTPRWLQNFHIDWMA